MEIISFIQRVCLVQFLSFVQDPVLPRLLQLYSCTVLHVPEQNALLFSNKVLKVNKSRTKYLENSAELSLFEVLKNSVDVKPDGSKVYIGTVSQELFFCEQNVERISRFMFNCY